MEASGFSEWLKALPGKVWLWLAGLFGGLVLLAGFYFSGAARRKGQVELEVAKRELEKANKEYERSVKVTEEIKEKQVRLVSDILTEQMRRAEELKRTRRLSDAEVVEELRRRGDITDDGN